MFGKDFKRQRAGQPIEARSINQFIGPTGAQMKLRVGNGLAVKWMNGIPLISLIISAFIRFYYTTSAITTSTASATGTAIGSATMTMGSGTARRCTLSVAGVVAPNTTATDDTIWNAVVYTTQIATGSFVLCVNLLGLWIVVLVVRCPGS